MLHYSVLNEHFYYRGKHILVICKQMLFGQLSGAVMVLVDPCPRAFSAALPDTRGDPQQQQREG